jgi:hypothetical protein
VFGSGRHDTRKNPVNHHNRRGGMNGSSIVSVALVALVGSAGGLYAAESETVTGTVQPGAGRRAEAGRSVPAVT